jgi:hypothetical protein
VAVGQQRNQHDRQRHGEYWKAVEQDGPGCHRHDPPERSGYWGKASWGKASWGKASWHKASWGKASAPLLPTPMSHSAVRRMSARARHEDTDQCRVSNWRALSTKLPGSPGTGAKRAISAMQ